MLRYASRAKYYARTAVPTFICAALMAITIEDNVVDVYAIAGQSMQPTLSPNCHLTGERDGVLFKKWNPTRNLQRGDVVVFSNPSKPETLSVKRVVALGGDTVLLNTKRRPKDIENGRENEAAKRWDRQFSANKGRIAVPPSHVWVEGDNVGHSNDSNAYGPISRSLIVGRASMLVWPLRQIGATPWTQWKGRGTKVVPGRLEDVFWRDEES